MPVILDSNVIYAGLYSPRGASHQILRKVSSGEISPAISISLYEEYSDVLRRKPLADQLSNKEVESFLDFFCQKATFASVYFLWRPFLKDPKDDLVLEAAVASASKIIVTHNLKDFKGSEQFGVQAISPKEFLNNQE